MPTYSYHCRKDRNGCGQEFRDNRSFRTINDAMCPYCGSSARPNRHGVATVEVLMPRVGHISDVDHQEGRTGDKVFMPAYGKHVSSRREISELQKQARENLFNRTAGRHEHFIRDPETGNVEKVTVESKGIDIGEIRTAGDSKFEPMDHAGAAEKEMKSHIEKSSGRKLGPDRRTQRKR